MDSHASTDYWFAQTLPLEEYICRSFPSVSYSLDAACCVMFTVVGLCDMSSPCTHVSHCQQNSNYANWFKHGHNLVRETGYDVYELSDGGMILDNDKKFCYFIHVMNMSFDAIVLISAWALYSPILDFACSIIHDPNGTTCITSVGKMKKRRQKHCVLLV